MPVPKFLLLFLAGLLSVQFFTELPQLLWIVFATFIAVFFCFIRYLRILGVIFLGVCWGCWHGYFALLNSLPESLQGENLLVHATIINLPKKTAHGIRFKIKPTKIFHQQKQIKFDGKILLSWYRGAQSVQAGEQWQFLVRLKKPHGFQSPGAFDYEQWLFYQGIRATGYVKKSKSNKKLGHDLGYGYQRIRQTIANQLQHVVAEFENMGLLMALAIGDRQKLTSEQNHLLIATGTSHIVAISGLHIGLIFGLIYALVFSVVRRIHGMTNYYPAKLWSAGFALFGAFCYALMAGFALPTQRALIMLTVVVIAMYGYRSIKPSQVLAVALLVVLVVDPFAVYLPGFWLSFIAVAAILWIISSAVNHSKIIGWLKIQWGLMFALLPILYLYFQQVSVVSPLTNLVVIPLISLVIVPMALLAILLLLCVPSIMGGYLAVLDYPMNLFWWVLQISENLPVSVVKFSGQNSIVFICLVAACFILLLPRGFPGKWLGVIFLLPAGFLAKPVAMPSSLKLAVLDVGQGLSVVIQTQNHTLVYDTGAKFSDRFNAADAVIIPYLKYNGIKHLDYLMISHSDNDHMGGTKALMKEYPALNTSGGMPDLIPVKQAALCHDQQNWYWDGVKFEILYPSLGMKKSGNNASCVLKITHPQLSVLITGDIEKSAEKYLIKSLVKNELDVDIIIVPHHGSKTSSSSRFIQLISPKHAVFSSGYRNRYHHPHKKIVKRYQTADSKLYNTASDGSIIFSYNDKDKLNIRLWRSYNKRYWN